MIDKTAIINKDAKVHSSVKVGPYSIIGPNVEIGEDTEIKSHVSITGNIKIGKRNKIYPFVSTDNEKTHCIFLFIFITFMQGIVIICIGCCFSQKPKTLLLLYLSQYNDILESFLFML